MPDEPTQSELDQPETTVNAVDPEDWEGENPRRLDPDQSTEPAE